MLQYWTANRILQKDYKDSKEIAGEAGEGFSWISSRKCAHYS